MQIEGRNPTLEALRANRQLKKLYMQIGINKDEKISEILKLARQSGIRIESIAKKKLDRMSRTSVHQGVIAVTQFEQKYFSTQELINKLNNENLSPFIVIIREVLYEYNLGAIIRTAASAGVNGIIISPKEEIGENAIRSSMGANNYMNFAKDSLFVSLKVLKQNGIRIGGIELSGKKYYYEEDLTGPIALIIGGEDKGLSSEIIEKCDFSVKIPMFSKVNSLNMSVAASVVMYEKVRQELI